VAPREAQRTHRDRHPREKHTRRLARLNVPLPKATFIPPATRRQTARSLSGHKSTPRSCTYGILPRNYVLGNGIRQWLEEYRNHMQALNRRERTIRTHVARLRIFFAFALSRNVTSCLDVDHALILDYREHIQARLQRRKDTRSAAVQNQFLAVVQCFFRFLVYREALTESPATGVRYAREPAKLPRGIPSADAISRILEQPDLNTPMGLRDRAIMEVLYSCGLRKGELIALSPTALNLDEGRLSIWAGKGEKDRVIPVGKLAIHFVRQYMELVRPWLVTPVTPPDVLFLSMRGRRLPKNSLFCLVKKHAVAAGTSSHGITPHTFRHAFATHLIQNGANLRHVQEMLGHANISSTQTYVHLAIRDLKRVHRRTHPLG
jgi:integrase/recombinase XerD